MEMIVKILFFDTSALLKMFVKEDGSENVKWLTHPETKICNTLRFFVNDQVCLEFENKISQFEKIGKISKKRADQIMDSFSNDYKNDYFTVLGKKSLLFPNKKQTSIDNICDELNLKTGKNDWDGFMYQSIIDSLAFFDAESHPILVTCDEPFGKKVKNKGYRVINPLKQNCEEMKAVFT